MTNFNIKIILNLLEMLLIMIITLATPVAARADYDKYAGVIGSWIFAGNAPDSVLSGVSSSSTDLSSMNWGIGAYISFANRSNIRFEHELTWLSVQYEREADLNSNNNNSNISVDMLAFFSNFGYDLYAFDMMGYDGCVFAQVGVGMANLYNIHGFIGGVHSIDSSYHVPSKFGFGTRGRLGLRVVASECSSVSINLSVFYITSLSDRVNDNTPLSHDISIINSAFEIAFNMMVR